MLHVSHCSRGLFPPEAGRPDQNLDQRICCRSRLRRMQTRAPVCGLGGGGGGGRAPPGSRKGGGGGGGGGGDTPVVF